MPLAGHLQHAAFDMSQASRKLATKAIGSEPESCELQYLYKGHFLVGAADSIQPEPPAGTKQCAGEAWTVLVCLHSCRTHFAPESCAITPHGVLCDNASCRVRFDEQCYARLKLQLWWSPALLRVEGGREGRRATFASRTVQGQLPSSATCDRDGMHAGSYPFLPEGQRLRS